MIIRILTARDFAGATHFLWRPRQCGKRTLLRSLFPDAPTYDPCARRSSGG
jgi:hypothetical protein